MSKFDFKKIDAAYVNSLTNLIELCRRTGAEIEQVYSYLDGWVVTFKGIEDADAACHNGTNQAERNLEDHDPNNWETEYKWETIGFPWDEDDVSRHTAEWLACSVAKLQSQLNKQ